MHIHPFHGRMSLSVGNDLFHMIMICVKCVFGLPTSQFRHPKLSEKSCKFPEASPALSAQHGSVESKVTQSRAWTASLSEIEPGTTDDLPKIEQLLEE
ncbi:hypothetical protein Y032_0780g2300 [Ancylostoma ceylanicum]|uniref:Uncharacterized protein n=1 Tax=Ancylostoma ceylanicum TaxID=53326 RepID=A0A016WDB4_9BILA|nr:hypothetical protein Y032_0780g2300 [Ancylostoma ceylanicum]